MPASPHWFILLPALAFLGWRWPRLGLRRPLRATAALLAVILLADPQLPTRRGGMDLWVLLDRSDSTEDLVDRGLPEWRALLEKARPNRRDTLHVLDYAAEVVPSEPDGSSSLYASRRSQTRTSLALSHVLSAQPENRPARVLAFTDGFSTEPLREAAAKLVAQGIPLDYRLVQSPPTGDARVTRIESPARVQPGESFVLRVAAAGPDGNLPLALRRDGQPAGNAVITLRHGRGAVELTDRLPAAGAHLYEAEILPATDAHRGNNIARAWLEVAGGPRVVLITRYPDDPLAAAFQSQGLGVDILAEPSRANEGTLAGARAVAINNVPAFDLAPEFLRALDFFVREQGGGLLMAGGKHAFGAGGYFQSAIDPLLPVSMELKTEHRKLAVAMAIIMDRSGSMAASVPGPAGKPLTKMDLANSGAASAIDLLGIMDSVAVFAVDSSPHCIIPLTTLGERKPALINQIRKVQSMGGGIYVYEGLLAAWKELRDAPAGTRHVILFSDAADSEEPGQYKSLLAEMTKAGVTVSVIGLGTRADSDAKLLEDVAKRGNGRIQFTDRAEEIPRLFAQETVTVARSAFLTDPVAAQPTGDWSEISGQPLAWLPEVDGYNLSYARPEAAVALTSKDEYTAPLVATMRRGLGRTAAVSFPLGGEYSTRARAWPAYADFTKTLARWLAGPDLPAGLGLAHRLEGTRLTLDLRYAGTDWQNRLAANPPRLKLALGSDRPDIRDIPWQRLAPGHFSAAIDLEENQVARGVVQAGDHAITFGPLSTGVSSEWSFEPERLAELRAVSSMTGGRELLDLSQAWTRPPVIQLADLRVPLGSLLLLVILLDALATRMQWSGKWKFRTAGAPAGTQAAATPRQKSKTTRPAKQSPPANTPPSSPPPAAPSEDAAARRRSRFDRAKKGG